MLGKIIITFDDGWPEHVQAAAILHDLGLTGVFSIVCSWVDTEGNLRSTDLQYMAELGHFVCNHSWSHPKATASAEDISLDVVRARDWLNERGYHGDYYISPFGHFTIHGEEHLDFLLSWLKWIRVVQGEMTKAGYRFCGTRMDRSYPMCDDMRVMTVTAIGGIQNPRMVKESVDRAIDKGEIADLMYHRIGIEKLTPWDIGWDLFCEQMVYVAEQVQLGKLECITPDKIV